MIVSFCWQGVYFRHWHMGCRIRLLFSVAARYSFLLFYHLACDSLHILQKEKKHFCQNILISIALLFSMYLFICPHWLISLHSFYLSAFSSVPTRCAYSSLFILLSLSSFLSRYSSAAGPQEEPNRILLVTIHHMLYPITIEVLHQVFSPYGFVEKIVTFQKSAGQILSTSHSHSILAFNAVFSLPDSMQIMRRIS